MIVTTVVDKDLFNKQHPDCFLGTERIHKCNKFIWVKYDYSGIVDADIFKLNVSTKECQNICVSDPSCVGVTVGHEKSNCILKYNSRKIHYDVNAKLTTYLLACCATFPINSHDTDLCYEYKFHECKPKFELTWVLKTGLALNTWFKSYSNVNEIRCRWLCQATSLCEIVTFTYSGNCWLGSNEDKLKYKENYFSAILSFCPVANVHKDGYDILIESEKSISDDCSLMDRRDKFCSLDKKKWIKFSRVDSPHGDFLAFPAVTFEKCKELCFSKMSCSTFTFSQTECVLKYANAALKMSFSTDVYVYSCCKKILPVISGTCQTCFETINAISKCDQFPNTTPTWFIYFHTKFFGSYKRFTEMTQYDCRSLCAADTGCVYATYDTKGNCWFMKDHAKNIKNDRIFETAEIKCCSTHKSAIQFAYNLLTFFIFETITSHDDLRCEHVQCRTKSTCNHLKWMKWNKKHFEYMNIMVKQVQYMKECMILCNVDVNCIAFVYDKNKNCFLKHTLVESFEESFEESLEDNNEADTYVMMCCTDNLPIVIKNNNICRNLNNRKDKCNEEEILSWEIEYGTRFHVDGIQQRLIDPINCRIKCLQDPGCIVLTMESLFSCYFESTYNENDRSHEHEDENFDIFKLSCCVKEIFTVSSKQKTFDIGSPKVGNMCKFVKNRNDKCSELVYIKYENTKFQDYDIVCYSNLLTKLTVKHCMKLCNENIFCVSFNYFVENEVINCCLQHKVVKEIWSVNKATTTYVLACCPDMLSETCRTCKKTEITNKNDLCQEYSSIPTWRTLPFASAPGNTKLLDISVHDCRWHCLNSISCRTISYNHETQQCTLLTSHTEDIVFDESSEYAYLICEAQYDPLFIKTKQILRRTQCASNQCEAIDDRSGRCFTPVWIKETNNDKKYFNIKIKHRVTFDECLDLCNEHFSCLLFSYSSDDDGICHLKHVNEGQVQESNGHSLYVLNCFEGKETNDFVSLKGEDSDCFYLNSSHLSCFENFSYSWFMTKNIKSSAGDIVKFQSNVSKCNEACFDDPLCILTSFDKVNNICHLHDRLVKVEDPNFESTLIRCCSKVKMQNVWIQGQLCNSICAFHIFFREMLNHEVFDFIVVTDGFPRRYKIWLDGCSSYYFNVNNPGKIQIALHAKQVNIQNCTLEVALVADNDISIKFKFQLNFN